MNLYEVLFVSAVCGVGLGLGIACAKSHGILGFVVGFLVGIAGAMIAVTIAIALLPKKPKAQKPGENMKSPE